MKSTAKVEAVIGTDGKTVIVIGGPAIVRNTAGSAIGNTLAGGFGLNAQGQRCFSFFGVVNLYSGNKHFLTFNLPPVNTDIAGSLPDGTSVSAGVWEDLTITLRLFQRDPRAP